MKRIDKMRTLVVQELAAWIVESEIFTEDICQNKDTCKKMLKQGIEIPEEMCRECAAEWLNEEV
ncbi:MAG: hypothetical protein IJV67_02530 [Clostridia bacterium]|nr:hypothetical protein [Clostridia bacterium]